jgi:hypothetical protein
VVVHAKSQSGNKRAISSSVLPQNWVIQRNCPQLEMLTALIF